MTRNRFLRLLFFILTSLLFYPLRALAGGKLPRARVTPDSYSKRPPGITGSFQKPAPFPSPPGKPGLTRVADMQPQATPPPGEVPPITPNSDFYVEDIHGPPKHLNQKNWRLRLSGNIDHPLNLSLDDIRKRPTVRRIVTLSCIGNPVGGYAIGNAEWEGVSLQQLIAELQPGFFANTVIFKAADGYHESLSIGECQHPSALLAYRMNGEPLPRDHGFPLRLIIPGRYGIKQIKWINEIEVSDQGHTGYWPKRNWSRSGKIKILSRIDYPRNDGWVLDRRVVVRGIAFAGDRGIQYVQVSTDGERHWSLAKLDRPLSPYSWVFWSFPLDLPRPGRYSVAVRAADLYSGVQRDGLRDPFPSGAEGIHRIQFNVYPG